MSAPRTANGCSIRIEESVEDRLFAACDRLDDITPSARTKLDWDKAAEIRRRAAAGEPQIEVASAFGISLPLGCEVIFEGAPRQVARAGLSRRQLFDDSRWNANDQGMRRHVADHDRSGADDTSLPERHTSENSDVCGDPNAVFDADWPPNGAAAAVSRIVVVVPIGDQQHMVANRDVVANSDRGARVEKKRSRQETIIADCYPAMRVAFAGDVKATVDPRPAADSHAAQSVQYGTDPSEHF